MESLPHFGKIYHFPTEHTWTLPNTEVMFASEVWKVPELQDQKTHLNSIKSKLNNFPFRKWHRHTYHMNPAGMVMNKLRREFGIEFITQAWCKFYEILSTDDIIPYTAKQQKILNTIHLCEAPGAFIAALNHFLVSKVPELKWNWMATTLNPHYEGNDRDHTFIEDKIILSTYSNWNFGQDSTGDITKIENMRNIEEEVISRGLNKNGTLLMVTADGSIDCHKTPGEQENAVSNLMFCEAITALKVLDLGGSLVIKTFTVFECNTICLFYILVCSFKSVRLWKPATSREGNSESYLVCLCYNGKHILEPWLDVLCQNYGNIREDIAVFPKNYIPKDFIDCIVKSSAKFLGYQVEAINRNIATYSETEVSPINGRRPTASQYQLNALRMSVAETFCSIYEVEAIPKLSQIQLYVDKITKGNSMKWLPEVYQEPKDPTFLAKLQEPTIKEKLYNLREIFKNSTIMRNTFHYDDSYLLDHPLNDFIAKFVQVYPFIVEEKLDITLGKRIDKVRLSKFCHTWYLDMFDQLSSLYELIREFRKSSLSIENVAEGNQSMPSTSTGKDASGSVPASAMPPAQGLWSAACSKSSTSLQGHEYSCKHNEKPDYECTSIPARTMAKIRELSICLRNEKYEVLHWSSSRDSRFLHEVIRILDLVRSNENLMILDPFPLLTQFEVGLLYMMGLLFEEVFFICPVLEKPNGNFGILLHKRNVIKRYQNFVHNSLSDMLRITIQHEVEESGKQIISVLPVKVFLDDCKFYGSVLFANHICLEKVCKKLLHDCEKEFTYCETSIEKLE